ncbi:MAG: glycosyltransferase family 39 protein [Bryobacterales bacterium]|nr:glycosyltransferase family 39 protein [Bryobacterales bacterium]
MTQDQPATAAGRLSAGELAALVSILAIFVCVLVALAWEVGVTVDEPSHLVSAHLYWEGKDRLAPYDMPPAIKIAGGWVSHLTGVQLPARTDAIWKDNHEWQVALRLMESMKADQIRRTFFLSRLPMIVFPVGCAAVIWWWTRQLFGKPAALVSTALFTLSPTVLAHGMLFKNDLAASLGLLLVCYTGWRYAAQPGRGTLSGFALAAGFALLTKLSMLAVTALVPLFLAGVAWKRGMDWRSYGRHLGILVAVIYAMIVVLWPGRITVLPRAEWAGIRAMDLPWHFTAIMSVLRFVPLPRMFWHGVAAVAQSDASGVGVYLLGNVYPQGHPLYFFIAWAVKIPVAVQAMVLLGLAFWGWRWFRKRTATDAFWLLPAALYMGLASMSSLQLGIRLVLPAIVCSWMSASRGLQWVTARRWSHFAVAALLTWQATRTAIRYPDYIAYFNLWVGGPEQGIRYLSDSNLDWGQGLHALREYLDRNGVKKVSVFYFGNDNAWQQLREERLEMKAAPWTPQHVQEKVYQPEAGLYAVSATFLTGQLFQREYRDYFRRFRERKPEAVVAGSIHIYRVE